MNKPVFLFLLFLAVVHFETAFMHSTNLHPEFFSDRSQISQKEFTGESPRRRLQMYAPQYVTPNAYNNPRFLTNNSYQTANPQANNLMLPQIMVPQIQNLQNPNYQTRDLGQSQILSNGGNLNSYANQEGISPQA